LGFELFPAGYPGYMVNVWGTEYVEQAGFFRVYADFSMLAV
jgi:hypothetical protein